MKAKLIDTNKLQYLYDNSLFTEEEIYTKGFREVKYLNNFPKNYPYYYEAVLVEDKICITYLPKMDKDITLEEMKLYKKIEIKQYDTSIEINEFHLNNIPMWLDKQTRVGLKLRFDAELSSNITYSNLWYKETKIEFPTETGIQMLMAVERYASESYDITQQHLKNVEDLTTLDEVKNYNYKINYPIKIRL